MPDTRVKIAKEFRWEMAHRLPYHQGGCQNLHGHSYRLTVEVEGIPDKTGMVMDYADLKTIVKPLIDDLDHGFMCSSDDALMRSFLTTTAFKVCHVDFYSTAENIALYFAGRIKPLLTRFPNVKNLKVRVNETRTTYAEVSFPL